MIITEVDFLHVHPNSCVKQPHVNAPGTVAVAPELIRFQYQLEVFIVLLLTLLPGTFFAAPAVVTGAGYPGHFTQGADAQKVVVLLDRVGDELVLHFCWCLDSHCF